MISQLWINPLSRICLERLSFVWSNSNVSLIHSDPVLPVGYLRDNGDTITELCPNSWASCTITFSKMATMMTGIPQYQRASVNLHIIWPQLLIITHLVKNSFSLPRKLVTLLTRYKVPIFYEVRPGDPEQVSTWCREWTSPGHPWHRLGHCTLLTPLTQVTHQPYSVRRNILEMWSSRPWVKWSLTQAWPRILRSTSRMSNRWRRILKV